MIQEGDIVLVTVEAEVLKVSRGHGECYLVELPQKDFTGLRTVWVNEDETEQREETNF